MQTLIALLIALVVIERSLFCFNKSHYNIIQTYKNYICDFLKAKEITNEYVALAAVVLPIGVLIGFIDWLIWGLLFNVIWILFATAAFLFAIGPKIGPLADEKAILTTKHENLFAIIFWFSLLGPVAAIIYRIILDLKNSPVSEDSKESDLLTMVANKVYAIIDWLPARLTALAYALVGNFSSAFRIWHTKVVDWSFQGQQMLEQCGLAAIVDDEVIATPDSDASTVQVDSLVRRTLYLWVGVCSLIFISHSLG